MAQEVPNQESILENKIHYVKELKKFDTKTFRKWCLISRLNPRERFENCCAFAKKLMDQ